MSGTLTGHQANRRTPDDHGPQDPIHLTGKPHRTPQARGAQETLHHPHRAQGIRLAYRRNQSGGVWSVLKSDGVGSSWLQRFALADDHEDSNGSTTLDYWQACEVARKLARGDDPGEVEGGPATVAAAVDAYAQDLKARDGDPGNATSLRFHLTPALMSKPVSLLTAKEVRTFRDGLLDKGLSARA